MGSILVNYPDIADSDLVFDEPETKDILHFFWPALAGRITAMTVTADTRRFAQTLLIAAVDASYAMGFIHGLVDGLSGMMLQRKPGKGLRILVRKLAVRYVKHWWRHATRDNLLEAQIYESVRVSIANQLRSRMGEILDGIAQANPSLLSMYAIGNSRIVWS